MSFRTPKYRLHKASGQALVQISGERIYLGKYGTEASKEKYRRLVAEFLVGGQSVRGRNGLPLEKASAGLSKAALAASPIKVNQLILAFWQHAKQRYVKNGQPTSEVRSFRTALHPVRQLYGREPVTSFGPLALVACRYKLIEAGICRKRINQHVGRIRQAFKWGVAHELVPETTWRALCAVEGLRHGEAPERSPIRPVAEEHIAAIKPHVTPQVAAMIDLQLWSGCRPGEVCVMRTIDINTQGPIWEYRPHSHKTEHHGKERVIYLGPHAQEILKPWLKTDLHAYVFSPAEGRAWYQAQRAINRKTPKQFRSQPCKRKASPRRKPGNRYTNLAYVHAICRACEVAFGMPKELRRISMKLDADERKRLAQLAAEWRAGHCWSPNQLRHNAGTRIRAAYGIEASRIILGHASVATSEIYAEIDRDKAKEIMDKLG
jgi:integrase